MAISRQQRHIILIMIMQSPKRITVPLPAAPSAAADSIFATRISASKSMPGLGMNAITPSARRLLAAQQESTAQRDRTKAKAGLGEHMRHNQVEKEKKLKDRRDWASEDEADSGNRNEEEKSDKDQDDELEELPQPAKRRTRQRTRELSVLSDASNLDEDREDFSPRRSTRNKGKGKPNDVSPVQQQQKKNSTAKSAKSPPASNRNNGRAQKHAGKASKARDETDEEDDQEGSLVEILESGRKLRSSRPTSPAPTPKYTQAKGKRAASPKPSKDLPAPSIAQIMSTDEDGQHEDAVPNSVSRKRATRTQDSHQNVQVAALAKRPINGYSFDDDVNDLEEDPAFTKSSHHELAKLKLPSSVFASRFSFGKTPTSPILAAQRQKTPESRSLPDYLGERTPQTPLLASTSNTVLPSFPHASRQDAAAEAEPKALFSFAPPTMKAASPMITPAGLLANKSVAPDTGEETQGTFSLAKPDASKPPLFSFKAPIPSSATSIESVASDKPPDFSFTASSTPAAAEVVKPSAFTFGTKPASQEQERKTPLAAFNFGIEKVGVIVLGNY